MSSLRPSTISMPSLGSCATGSRKRSGQQKTRRCEYAGRLIAWRALRFRNGLWSHCTFNPSTQNTSVELLAIWWVAFPGVAGIAEMGAVRNLQCHTIAANRQITAVAFPVGSG